MCLVTETILRTKGYLKIVGVIRTMLSASSEGRDAVLAAFEKFNFSRDRFVSVYSDSALADFDFVSQGLNLFLSICGHGVTLRKATTLGERVRLAETLVSALEDMGYSAGLKAHQISGLDWKALRNVILWTGDCAASRREDAKREASLRYDEILDRRLEFRIRQQSSREATKLAVSGVSTEDEVPEHIPGKLDTKAIEKLRDRIKEQQSLISSAVAHLNEITRQGNELRDRLSTDIDEGLYRFEEIAALVEENESLKVMEKEFKSTCKKERERLTLQIQSLMELMNEDEQELIELREAKDRIFARLARARHALAGVSRQEAAEARIEDDAPTREELLQFERRFGELYEQMTLKSDEHRRHLATYNSLTTKLRLIQNHIQLLRSIRDGFEASKDNMNATREFRSQFQSVLEGVDRNLAVSKEKVANAERRRNESEEELQVLLAKQRRYFRAIRELQEAFSQNEKLGVAATDRKRNG